MTGDEPDEADVRAFGALAVLVEDWRAHGKRTTTAGVKPALIKAMDGDFNERDLGFASFRSFVIAAEAAGYISIHQPEGGHWFLTLPGDLPDLPDPPQNSAEGTSTHRLKAPIWSVFVEWGEDWVRLWDRKEGRAFWYPVAEGGQPAWVSDSDRFAPIEPASQSVQFGWMREWANTLAPVIRDQVMPAIGDDLAPGKFKERLVENDLVAAWRDELRRRVFSFACEWAEDNDIARGALLATRRPASPPAMERSRASSAGRAKNPTESHTSNSRAEASTLEAVVRSRVHAAVEQLTLAELLDLRLPVRSMMDLQKSDVKS